MTAIEETLARCEGLRVRAASVDEADVAWLVGCFDHPLKIVQRAAGETLAAVAAAGIEVGNALEDAMLDGSFRRRWTAAWTRSRIAGSVTAARLAVLLEAIGVDDGDVRWAAARILSSLEQVPTIIEQLVELAVGGNPDQRKMAVYCLRDRGATAPEILECYRGALGDPSPGVRLAAMSALARASHGAGDARRIAALVDDPDGGVRRAAAATVGRMGVTDDEVRECLERAAASDDPVLGRTARAALMRRG